MPAHTLSFPTTINLVEFISHHAHDLRSPYNRMLGFSKLMLKGQDGPLNEVQKEDLTTVYHNSLEAFRALNGLIDISRLLTGEKRLDITQVCPLPLREQLDAQWKRSFQDKEIELQVQLNTADQAIAADETHLRQAMLAWIACVVEFVTLPAQVSVRVDEEQERLLFTIASQGSAAPGPSALEVETNGYIGQTIITLHGGQFQRYERDETGAVICFSLPKA